MISPIEVTSMEDTNLQILRKKMWYRHHIQKIADHRHMSVGELSLMSGLSEEFLYKLWQGEVIPSTSSLQKLALALDVPLSHLELPENF